MEVTITQPSQQQTLTISWLEIHTPVGSFVIQPGHAPTILVLAKGQPITALLANGKKEVVAVTEGGIIQITRTSAKILLYE